MKILFIGGTGTISMAISKKLLEQGHELYLINRGNRNEGLAAQLPGTGEWNRPREIIADINREEEAAKLLHRNSKKLFLSAAYGRRIPTAYVLVNTAISGQNQAISLYQLRIGLSKAMCGLFNNGKYTAVQSLLAVFPGQDRRGGLPHEAVPGGRLPRYHHKAQPYL